MTTELACNRSTPYLSAFSSGRNIHFLKKNIIQLNLINIFISWKNTIHVRSRIVLTMYSLFKLSYHVKAILPICKHLKVGETFTLLKIALFRRIRETCVSLGTIPFVLEAGVSYILFPYEN
jgi:hypothetical protein